ncbi:hypothetical protein IAD21_03924 [Abditibacteriota bacterium]|nr:hypothetical protein IAD21_03924 [Abditibacteriota bacterium]
MVRVTLLTFESTNSKSPVSNLETGDLLFEFPWDIWIGEGIYTLCYASVGLNAEYRVAIETLRVRIV